MGKLQIAVRCTRARSLSVGDQKVFNFDSELHSAMFYDELLLETLSLDYITSSWAIAHNYNYIYEPKIMAKWYLLTTSYKLAATTLKGNVFCRD